MKTLRHMICLLLIMLLIPAAASAQTLDEWNRSCRSKTLCATKIYGSGDLNRGQYKGTIPANTYVKKHGEMDGMLIISYRASTGQSGMGLADPSCIGAAIVVFTEEDGDRHGMQDIEYFDQYGNGTPPGAVMDPIRPGYTDYTTYNPYEQQTPADSGDTATGSGSTGGSGSATGTGSTGGSGSTNRPTTNTSRPASSSSKPAASKSDPKTPAPEVLWQGGKVRVKTWGFHSSVIVTAGGEQTVPTRELTFSEDVDAAKRLAYIHAPRTGQCNLRQKASAESRSLAKCEAGAIVQVVKYGKSYCQIVWEGQVGYVQTSCLKFAAPDAQPIAVHPLSYEGRTTGAAQVPLRNAPDNESCIVLKARSGMEVAVFGQNGSWYEVEYAGVHGFVHKSFLVMGE